LLTTRTAVARLPERCGRSATVIIGMMLTASSVAGGEIGRQAPAGQRSGSLDLADEGEHQLLCRAVE
jgi:hypothetical protein